MAATLYTAPAAAGKTAYCINLARKTARNLQAEVRVCVPTGAQASAWRQRLAAAGGTIGVHVLTFDQLVATCLTVAGEAYTELSEPVQYRLLRTIIDDLPLAHYALLKAKPGFIQVAQQLIGELKSAHIDPLSFLNAVSQIGDEPRLREIGEVYVAYQEQLQARGWADRVGLHWLAVESLSERAPGACRDWPQLIVDGFDDFTRVQLALMQSLAGRVGHFVITLTQAENVDYLRYRTTRQEVEEALAVVAVPLPESNDQLQTQPALLHLGRHLFTTAAGDKPAAEDALTLRSVPDRAAEARTALRWLKQRIVQDGVPPESVALVARDILPYRPFIQQVAAEFGMPVRLMDGQPLSQSPVIAAVMALLSAHLPIGRQAEPDLPRPQVIAAWRSPYFRWEYPGGTISPADADALDTFARQQRVIRGLSQWQAAFAVSTPTADEVDDEELSGGRSLTATTIRQLQEKFWQFLKITRPPTKTTMQDYVLWLETLLGPGSPAPGIPPSPVNSLQIVAQARQSLESAEADMAALQTLKDILRGLVWAEQAVDRSRPVAVDFPAFFGELSGAILATQYMMPAHPDRSEIVVASVTQVRGLSFEAVAVMGLSEGSFPATVSEDPFLRDSDRQQLQSRFSLPLKSSTRSAEREFFYEAVTRARQRLLLTRPVLADNGAEWVASPFWEAAGQLVEVEPEVQLSDQTIPLQEAASWVEWWETLASDPAAAEYSLAQESAVLQKIAVAAQIWQARQAEGASAWNGDLSLLADQLGVRYGSEHVWSASRLESFQTCAFLFFVNHGLEFEPRPEPAEGLNARQLGRLYHRIFEKICTVGPPDSTDALQLQEFVETIAAPILDAAPADEGFRETPWWSSTRAEITDNISRSVSVLNDDDYEFAQAETSFGFTGPPLVIEVGDEQVRLRGFIDRIDRSPDGQIRLVDYKLGGKSAYSARALAEGRKLQLPLYALAAQETLALGQVKEGFYWHYQQAEPSPFTLARAEGGVQAAIDRAVDHAAAAIRQIRAGSYAPRPPAEGCPTYCPAAGFCWSYSPRSW